MRDIQNEKQISHASLDFCIFYFIGYVRFQYNGESAMQSVKGKKP